MALVSNCIQANKELYRKEMQRWSLKEIAIPPVGKTIKSNSVERYPRNMKIKKTSWSTHVWTWISVCELMFLLGTVFILQFQIILCNWHKIRVLVLSVNWKDSFDLDQPHNSYLHALIWDAIHLPVSQYWIVIFFPINKPSILKGTIIIYLEILQYLRAFPLYLVAFEIM